MSRARAACLLLALGAAPAAAQEIEESVLVDASRRPRVGASVTLLTRADFEAHGLLTVADAMALATGLRLDGGGSRGGTNAASLRGGDPNQVLVAWDGIVLNDPTGPEGGAVNLAALSLHDVETIEIVRGPAAAVHGGRAVAGLVRVRTRRSDGALRGRLEGGAGSFRHRQAGAGVSFGSSRSGGRLRLARETESGRLPGDSFQLGTVQAGWRRELGGEAELDGSARWSRRRSLDHPPGSGGPLLGDGALRNALREELGLAASWRFAAGGAWRHRLLVTAADHDEESDSPAIGFLVPASNGRTRYRRVDAGWTASRSLASRWGLLAALGLMDETARQRGTLDLGGPVPSDYELERRSWTGSLSLSGTLGRSSWEAALRTDLPDRGSAQWSGQAGFVRRFREGRTQLAVSFAEGFQQPSAFALAAPPALGGNPALLPERSRSLELGLEGRSRDGRFSGSARAWAARYRDLVDFDFATFSHVNRGSVEAMGVECEGRWSPGGRVALGGRLAWQDVRDGTRDERLSRRPRWVGAVDLAVRASGRWSFVVDLRGRSSFLDEQVPVEGPRPVAGGLTLGGALNLRAGERFEARLRLDDLLGSGPEPRLGYPAPGRSVRLDFVLHLAKRGG